MTERQPLRERNQKLKRKQYKKVREQYLDSSAEILKSAQSTANLLPGKIVQAAKTYKLENFKVPDPKDKGMGKNLIELKIDDAVKKNKEDIPGLLSTGLQSIHDYYNEVVLAIAQHDQGDKPDPKAKQNTINAVTSLVLRESLLPLINKTKAANDRYVTSINIIGQLD